VLLVQGVKLRRRENVRVGGIRVLGEGLGLGVRVDDLMVMVYGPNFGVRVS